MKARRESTESKERKSSMREDTEPKVRSYGVEAIQELNGQIVRILCAESILTPILNTPVTK